MPLYTDPMAKIAEPLFLTFILAGFGLSLGVGLVLAITADEGESLLSLVFWPFVGSIGFACALYHTWAILPDNLE